MWKLFVFLHIIVTVIYSRSYRSIIKYTKNYEILTIILQLLAGISVLLYSFLFDFSFPSDISLYILLIISCILYTIYDRLYSYVCNKIELSSFTILKQFYVIFLILIGLFFFKESFVINKIIGAVLIIFGNIFVFYKKSNQKFNKYVLLAIISNLAFASALAIDINISKEFNLAIYVSITQIVPALLSAVNEKINITNIKDETKKSNKVLMFLTGLFWGTMILLELKAFQLGSIINVAPLTDLVVIFSVFFGYFFMGEKDNLIKKIISLIIIIVGSILILI